MTGRSHDGFEIKAGASEIQAAVPALLALASQAY
jgi:hypothetical protein